jgi:DNA-binding HxlR family transcriptional regulator
LSHNSRLEHGKQNPSEQIDALVRVMYVLFSKDPELVETAQKMAEWIDAEVHSPKESKTVMKVSADNQWIDNPVAA